MNSKYNNLNEKFDEQNMILDELQTSLSAILVDSQTETMTEPIVTTGNGNVTTTTDVLSGEIFLNIGLTMLRPTAVSTNGNKFWCLTR